jgi:hexosaminidase
MMLHLRRNLFFLLTGFVIIISTAQSVSQSILRVEGDLAIAPLPVSMVSEEGSFIFNERTWILVDSFPGWTFDPVQVFRNVFKRKSGYVFNMPGNVIPRPGETNIIRIIRDEKVVHPEGYILSVTPSGITIKASTEQGVFYAFQTLRQIMRMDALPDTKTDHREWQIPAVEISDFPLFEYRGLHLDVCRHFMPLEFVKKYIDLLAYYKMNRFHWHLTDDQGWRIEIKQYPRLQEIAAWRDETLIGHYRETPDRYDGKRHGGYYTQDEIREVVAYASLRGVTIIPEIEMPGHSLAVLSAYPELACTPGPFKAATTWGVFDDVLCPSEETFTFLQNVLDEVISLFPSSYIHIGGDECPKTRWEESAFCQEMMKAKGLKDEHELQSYFIQRIEKYLNSKGRNIIGWNEILEGGLAPNATVMSWQGMSGGIAAAKAGHDVIMTPGTHCYFDHYQADPAFEPIAIGGLTTLEKVYAFNPVPTSLTAKEATYILGGQGNLWTEYIDTPEHAEYMAYPRAIALAEALWTPAERKDWSAFVLRLNSHLERLDGQHVNYAKRLSVPSVKIWSGLEGLKLTWNTDLAAQRISFTRDTTSENWETALTGETTLFSEPGPVFYKTDRSEMKKLSYTPTLTRQATISTSQPASASYPGRQGVATLIDGLKGKADFNGEDWCAWNGKPFSLEIDFKGEISPDSIRIGLLANAGAWIYFPQSIDIQYSVDNMTYSKASSWNPGEMTTGREEVKLRLSPARFRYLKLTISPLSSIPAGKPGAGRTAWTFLDEIAVY